MVIVLRQKRANPTAVRVKHENIKYYEYTFEEQENESCIKFLRPTEINIKRGFTVYNYLNGLINRGLNPDIILAHPSWGEASFLRDLFPNALYIKYAEFFHNLKMGNAGWDKEFPKNEMTYPSLRIKNSQFYISYDENDHYISPTKWQSSTFPEFIREKTKILFDGVDTEIMAPNNKAVFSYNGKRFSSSSDNILYLARNLEPHRGFHSFMRSVPFIRELNPSANIFIVGNNGVSYGSTLDNGETYKQKYIKEWNGLKQDNIFFIPFISLESYIKLLQITTVRVYLSYPFVTSWSLFESLAVGNIVIGSDTPPVQELIIDGENGFMVDFFDYRDIAEKIKFVLDNKKSLGKIKTTARNNILEQYSKEITQKKFLEFFV